MILMCVIAIVGNAAEHRLGGAFFITIFWCFRSSKIRDGYLAEQAGVDINECPYDRRSQVISTYLWTKGWDAGRRLTRWRKKHGRTT